MSQIQIPTEEVGSESQSGFESVVSGNVIKPLVIVL